MFLRAALAALALALPAAPATAQQLLATYFAMLDPHDMRNSSGVTLRDFGAILQQDRANYHRFGRRNEMDGSDPFFGNPALRARIPELYARGPGAPDYIRRMVLSGTPRFVMIRVYGQNGTPAWIEVSEGAG